MRHLTLVTTFSLVLALGGSATAGPPALCVDPCPDCGYTATDALVVLQIAVGIEPVDCSTTTTTLAPTTTTTVAPTTTTVLVTTTTMPPALAGACCRPDELPCVLTTSEACAALDGTYDGDNTICENSACGPQFVMFSTTIDCSQATTCTEPPCTGSGSGTFALELTSDLFAFDISYMNLSSAETVAHIHGPAMPGETAGVQVDLPLGESKIGDAILTEQQQADMLNDLYYVNIHSANCPGGEIRGQIIRDAAPTTTMPPPPTPSASEY